MDVKKITAIIPCMKLDDVEKRLIGIGVRGMSITHVLGLGEYTNFFRKNGLCRHARIEIFVRKERVDEIVTTIMDTVHTGAAGDGVIAVLPVETVYRIRTKQEAELKEI